MQLRYRRRGSQQRGLSLPTERAGSKPIPTMDLLIGVQAKCYGLPLLAGRDTHFREIAGLVVEDY
jgi:hypothetical protein